MLSPGGVKQLFIGAEKPSPTMASSFTGAALAKRKVTNATGLDLFVPKFDTTEGAGRETLYHVIVISVMSVFKTPRHTAQDVVQFSVARKYAEFEKLQEELSVEFSAIVFPSLPPRRLFCTEDDLEDRMVAFDSMMRVVAKTKRLCRSRSLLRFFGVSDSLIDKFLKEVADENSAAASGEGNTPTAVVKEEEPEVDIFADADEEDDDDDDGDEDEASLDAGSHDLDIDSSLKISRKGASDEVVVSDYLLAAGGSDTAESKTVFSDSRTEDRTEELTNASGTLFEVDDQLDSIDHLAKPTKKKTKSKAKAKPRSFDDTDSSMTDKQFASMDLQQYIASNTAAASADVDLFS